MSEIQMPHAVSSSRIAFFWATLALAALVPAGAQGTRVESEADWKVAKSRFEHDYSTGSEAKRLEAVERLGGCDYRDAVELLIQLIARPDPRLRELQKQEVEAQAEFEQAYAAYLADARKRNDGTVLASLGIAMERAQDKVQRIRHGMHDINQVPTAAEKGLARTTREDAVTEICQEAAGHKAWHVRAACTRALGKIGGDLAESTILGATGDDVTMVRMSAAEALGLLEVADAVDELVKLLDDKAWQVRAASVQSLRQVGRKAAVKPLIDHLAGEEGRLREDIDDALASLTGVQLHGDHQQWLSWWAAQGEEFMNAPPPPPPAPAPEEAAPEELAEGADKDGEKGEGEEGKEDDDKGTEDGEEADADPDEADDGEVQLDEPEDGRTVSFYGIRTKSKQILFIVDISGSMGEPAGRGKGRRRGGVATGGDAGGSKLPAPELPENPTKLDVARYGSHKAILALEEDALFNILVYSDTCDLFRPKKMIPADNKGKKSVIRKIAALAPVAGTNIHDALDLGFQLAGRDTQKSKRPKEGIDTIFFLSDGQPTVGGMTDTAKILEAVNTWNRSMGIKVHSIGVGKDHSRDFMRRLAEDNGGTYVTND